jgi:hypothetical protein
MPEMQNLDSFPCFIDPVIHIQGRMLQPSYVRVPSNRGAHIREGGEQFQVAKEVCGEPICVARVLFSGPIENYFQVG